jgi:hypothetical protein
MKELKGVADVPQLGICVGVGDTPDVRKLTEQDEWSPQIPCPHCGKIAYLMLAARDKFFGEYPNVYGSALISLSVLGHDCMAIAVYGCPDCQKATADWNCA